jgi:hypothetical protein
VGLSVPALGASRRLGDKDVKASGYRRGRMIRYPASFDQMQFQSVELYAAKSGTTFAEAIRTLIEFGLEQAEIGGEE